MDWGYSGQGSGTLDIDYLLRKKELFRLIRGAKDRVLTFRGRLSARGKLVYPSLQGAQPKRMLIHAGNQGKLCSTCLTKTVSTADADFLNGFQAIGNKGGTNYMKLLDASLCQLGNFKICIRLKPGVAPKPGLERNGVFVFGQPDLLDKSGDSAKALGAVTSRVSRRGRVTAGSCREAMTPGRVGLSNLAFGHAVKTEEEMVKVAPQVFLRAAAQSTNVIRMIKVGRLDLNLHLRRHGRRDFFDPLNRRFEARHGIVGKQGDEEEVVH